MLIVKDSNPNDLSYFKEKYNIELSSNYEKPEIFFTLFEDEEIVGYSQIEIDGKKCYLKDFLVVGDFDFFDKNFYLKATASKVYDLGFEYLNYENKDLKDLLPPSPIYILDFLKGSCCND
ncbi:hypothetical protein [Mediannikoviicoccus vaginalis]|uniref:hypothetical protein n=1 Tax=Mediannikoviicoccus vaginalis TaxID=2899727 RepID=UPI001F38E8C8|nr:hypothetical protein [Mediannikoviicoccus vaginalis]